MMCADIHYEKFIGLSLLYIHTQDLFIFTRCFFYNKTNMYSIFLIVKKYFHFDQL